MEKKIDKHITTLGDFRYATKDLKDSIQLYIQDVNFREGVGPLVEVTEIQLMLPKKFTEDPYIILRCV